MKCNVIASNNIKVNDKSKLNVIYQYIESDVSAKIFLKKLEQQIEVSYHLNTEKNGDYERAKSFYNQCLSMKGFDYERGIHQKAKAGLNRIAN